MQDVKDPSEQATQSATPGQATPPAADWGAVAVVALVVLCGVVLAALLK